MATQFKATADLPAFSVLFERSRRVAVARRRQYIDTAMGDITRMAYNAGAALERHRFVYMGPD